MSAPPSVATSASSATLGRTMPGVVKRSLSNVVGGLGLLALTSLLVLLGAEGFRRTGTDAASNLGPTSTAPADPTSPGMAVWLAFEVFEPGLLFFVGCLVVGAVLAWRARR